MPAMITSSNYAKFGFDAAMITLLLAHAFLSLPTDQAVECFLSLLNL